MSNDDLHQTTRPRKNAESLADASHAGIHTQPGSTDEEPEPWQTVSSEVVLANPPWYSMRRDRVRTHSGDEITYTYMDHPGAVYVVPVSRDGRLYLLRQYRYPVRAWCWEVPAGSIEPGEDGVTAAVRELAEELGGTSASIRHVASFFASNGLGNEQTQVYLATNVEVGPNKLETTELLRVSALPVAQVLRMAHSGEITDGQSALAILLCEPHLA